MYMQRLSHQSHNDDRLWKTDVLRKASEVFYIISFLYRSAYRHVTKFLKLIKYLLLLEPVTQRGANIFFSLFLILIFFHCFAFLSLHFNKIVQDGSGWIQQTAVQVYIYKELSPTIHFISDCKTLFGKNLFYSLLFQSIKLT